MRDIQSTNTTTNTNTARVAEITARLQKAFSPTMLNVIDDSHKHIGHAGAASGAGHFTVEMITTAFDGLSMLQRHRAIYRALDDMMPEEIHALAIDAKTPSEV